MDSFFFAGLQIHEQQTHSKEWKQSGVWGEQDGFGHVEGQWHCFNDGNDALPTNLETEISQQLFEGLPRNCVQTSMIPR